MENLYALGCVVLGVSVIGLSAWALLQRAEMQDGRALLQMWQDAYHGEVARHTSTLDVFYALRQSHAQLQADYLAQGRALTLAQGLAKAAERVE